MSYSHQKGFGWPHTLFALVLTVTLFLIFAPMVFSRGHGGSRTEALNNAKAIAGGLVAFKADKGAYPCAFTREAMDNDGIDNLPEGTDANAYLAQLIVTDIIDDEGIFFAPKVGTQKGDNQIDTPNTLLAPGENSFAYIMAPNEEPLTDVQAETPLVLAPIKTSGENPTFYPEPYKNKGVYGAVDGSGKVFDIDQHGFASTQNRPQLFATGPKSIFGKDTPNIKLPREWEPSSPKNPIGLQTLFITAILALVILILKLSFPSIKPPPASPEF